MIKLGTNEVRKRKPFSNVHWRISKADKSWEFIVTDDKILNVSKKIEPNGRPIMKEAAIVTRKPGNRCALPLL